MPDNLPALPPLTPDAIAAHIAGWPRRCQDYIMLRLRSPETPKAHLLAQLGLSPNAIYGWRDGSPPYSQRVVGFWELDQAIERGLPMLQQEMARAVLLNAAPSAADRLVHRALDMPTTTDRQLQVSHQAGIAILEATGVIQRQPSVVVDNRRVDVVAQQAWQEGGAQAWQSKRRPRIVQNDDMPPSEAPSEAKRDE